MRANEVDLGWRCLYECANRIDARPEEAFEISAELACRACDSVQMASCSLISHRIKRHFGFATRLILAYTRDVGFSGRAAFMIRLIYLFIIRAY